MLWRELSKLSSEGLVEIQSPTQKLERHHKPCRFQHVDIGKLQVPANTTERLAGIRDIRAAAPAGMANSRRALCEIKGGGCG